MTDELAAEETPRGAAPRATLAEIAALARVSIATVSKVLNGRDGVSEETRSRVDALLGENNYSRRTRTHLPAPLIEVLCFDIAHAFSASMIAAIERAVRAQGMGLVVTGADADHRPAASWADDVIHRQPRGVILLMSELSARVATRLRSRELPIVTINPFGAPPKETTTIGSADWDGGYAATRHLLELGHRRIAIIKGPEGMRASAQRLAGYRTAMETAGIRVRPEWIKPGRFIHSDGYEQGRALLELPDRPTAIFGSSDLQALGVYDAARAMGLDVPGDVSVVGYGDLSNAESASPPMTTVHVPIDAMAEQALSLVTAQREQLDLPARRVDLPVSLKVRASTAPPAAAP
ncbi:LacI family DNA-binding transcriptional regulator [Gryllotalpicola daejeonensis]|uniref:LacI family DNA-binding transcriptional regulator n=1 Tax=Gryllotalpicola daejeonensis TaxID=993087 RepID=UPI0031D2F3AE